MRDPRRIRRITRLIENIWNRYPDMRFGQLYMSLFTMYERHTGIKFRDYWNVEDSHFEKFLNEFEGFK